jgi:hypothetical protein
MPWQRGIPRLHTLHDPRCSVAEREELRAGRGRGRRRGGVEHGAGDGEHGLVVAVERRERDRALAAVELEQLAVGDEPAAVRAAAAREEDDLVASRAARVEAAHHQHVQREEGTKKLT